MVFSSLIFLFRFMPIFFLFYFILPMKYKNLCLLIFSLLFYSWGEPKYIILMIAPISMDSMAINDLPCAVINGLSPCANKTNTEPNPYIFK